MRSLIIAILFISFIGCRKGDDGKQAAIPSGLYKGTFTRTTTNGPNQCDVTIRITGDQFEAQEVGIAGYSGTHAYPIVGKGRYTITDKKATFENAGVFTADFDWTIILSGKYSITVTGNKIEIVREYESVPNGKLKDAYVLVKQ